MSQITNNKRIAKNTFVLYVRMIIVTLVGLYTSRVVLKSLGFEDFGLYNVVGGVVSLFSFFRTSMEKCTQRFLNVEMVKDDGNLHDTYSNAIIIHIGLALIALFLAETIGLWFLNTYINIPIGREFAANCVYQTVVIGLLLTILTIPLSATIISHERMGVFALMGIIDSILNLSIALLLANSSYDRLILYSILMLFVRIANFVFHLIYCKRKFSETKGRMSFSRQLSMRMLSYTSWTLLGHTLIILTNQGNSILVNMFHGVGANAAIGVANQVNGHVLHLTGNFQTAFNPQITKAYAANKADYLNSLIISTSKLSYYLLLIVSLPLLFNIDFILGLWLEIVPPDTNIFCILMLSSGILQATTSPLNFSIMATGEIKWFQITTGLVFISDLFILYSLFHIGMPAPTAMWVKLSIMVIVCLVRIYYANRLLPSFEIKLYMKKVLFPITVVCMISVIFACFIRQFVSTFSEHLISMALIGLVVLLIILVFGLSTSERSLIINFIRKK